MKRPFLRDLHLGLLSELTKHLSEKRKMEFFSVSILLLFASFAEMLSIGSVVPLLTGLTNPSFLFENEWSSIVLTFFEIKNYKELVVFLVIMFCTLALFSGIFRLFLLFLTSRLAFGIGSDISHKVFKTVLYMPFEKHIKTNSSDIISGTVNKIDIIIGGLVRPWLQLFSNLVLLLIVVGSLVFLNPVVGTYSLAAIGLVYFVTAFLTRMPLAYNGKVVSKTRTLMIKTLQEALRDIRGIILHRGQKYFLKEFSESNVPLRVAEAGNQIISGSPRFITETLGIIMIACFAGYISYHSNNGFIQAVPLFGVIVLAAQRMLPVVQSIYASWAAIKAASPSAKDALSFLHGAFEDKKSCKKLSFSQSIELKNINFGYSDSSTMVLKNVNFKIKRREIIGIIGKSGSGKSTLIDLMMGLLIPNSGEVLIDGKRLSEENLALWQTKVNHVPQRVNLLDSSIKKNIAFCVPDCLIDMDRVIEASRYANILDDINCLPEKFEALAGEDGENFSGGQRQRLGIARALYLNADVFFFDEATSALDRETEAKVLEKLFSFNVSSTIIMATHKQSNLERCDKIIYVSNGCVQVYNSIAEVNNKNIKVSELSTKQDID